MITSLPVPFVIPFDLKAPSVTFPELYTFSNVTSSSLEPQIPPTYSYPSTLPLLIQLLIDELAVLARIPPPILPACTSPLLVQLSILQLYILLTIPAATSIEVISPLLVHP